MPGGGQRVAKVHLKGWRQIDWGKASDLFTFRYGAPYLDAARRKQVKDDEVVLVHWSEGGVDGGIITYYKLPPIVQRIVCDAFERGKGAAKAELKRWFGMQG